MAPPRRLLAGEAGNGAWSELMAEGYRFEGELRPRIVLCFDHDDVLILNASYGQLAALNRAGRAALATAKADLAGEGLGE